MSKEPRKASQKTEAASSQPSSAAAGARSKGKRIRIRGTPSSSDSVANEMPIPTTSTTPAGDSQLAEDGVESVPPKMTINAGDDGVDAKDSVGYKNPPKHTRFKPGQSGNPSGKRKRHATPPGNVLQNIGHEIADEVSRVMLAEVRDLQIKGDDLVTTALAKTLVGGALQRNPAASKFVFNHFFEKPLNSERLAPVDPREAEADILRKMLYMISDPGVSDDDINALLAEANDHHETYGEFGARRRKARKKRQRRRRSSKNG